MSTKSKGSNAERELIHMFWSKGFAAIRSAGSGSMKYPSPDLLVAKNNKILAIECKITKNTSKYFEKREIEELAHFSKIFNSISYIAIKFKANEWFFLEINQLIEKEKSFMIDIKTAKQKAKTFEELLNVFIKE
jgi:holliday junction resolvase Hjr